MNETNDKNISMICHSFFPESSAAAKRFGFISSRLMEAGYNVSVYTINPHYPANRLFAGFERNVYSNNIENGIRVYRFKARIFNRKNFIVRIFDDLIFSIGAVHKAVFKDGGRLLYASSPYIITPLIACVYSRIFKTDLVLEYRDIMWRYGSNKSNSIILNLFVKLMDYAHGKAIRHAKLVIVTTHGQANYLKNLSFSEANIRVIPNGINPEENRLGYALNKETIRPIVTYAGVVGIPQGLQTIIDVAKRMDHVDFYIAGDGNQLSSLKDRVEREGIKNVIFLGFINKTELMELYCKTDIFFLQLISDSGYEYAEPSKIWEYMLYRKPVVFASNGELSKELHQCGICELVPPEDTFKIIQSINKLLNNNNDEMVEKAYQYTINNRNRKIILDRLVKFIEEVNAP